MDFIGLSTTISELHLILLREDVLNKRQCINLVNNIQNAVKAIQKLSGSQGKDFVHAIGEEFTWIVNKAKDGIEECCKEDWCHAAVMQVNNKEYFRELLFDLDYCFQTICEISRCRYPDQSEVIAKVEECTTFYPASLDEVEEDRHSLLKKLEIPLDLHTTEHRELAEYLRGQVVALQKVEGGELDNMVIPDKYPNPEYGNPLTTLGQSGPECVVYATRWVGMECATKVITFDLEGEQAIMKEAKLLRGLNHPNIIKLFCCGFKAKQRKIELVMEKGIMDLSKFLRDKRVLLTKVCAVDIMIQIASGMCYLHDMRVAHRDLKPGNIIVTAIANSNSNNVKNVHVKLLDFGISKMGVKDFGEIPIGKGMYGTCGYVAPEAFENRSLEVDVFKTDVFSFGVVCYEILSGKRFYDASDSMIKYVNFAKTTIARPQLPEGCSMELKSLINNCWASKPAERPKFIDIYNKLVLLKRAVIKKASQDRATNLHEEFTSYRSVQTIPKYWWTIFYGCLLQTLAWLQAMAIRHVHWLWSIPKLGRTNTPMSVPIAHQEVNKDIKIGLKKIILELEKRLQTCGGLGIIGMGGVGKSTLAYALSNHVSHQFEATIFVNDLMDERCTFISRDEMKDLQSPAKVITLLEAHKLIQEMQRTKRILIVLDNVGKQSQLQDLLGNDVLGYGSKLVASSRDWKCLEGHVKMDGKIDMDTLGKCESLNLFSMHAFTGNQPCLPYLTNVAEKIVKACGGLPLSLEVMGIYLQGEKRLRIWERTLQRLLRGRHDGNIDERIWRTLRIGFDELNDATKNMFLDIACFFCKDTCLGGVSKDTICTIFSDDDDLARETLQSLIDKSLLKVGNDGLLDMHDQLRNMGRMIVEKEAKFKGSRMWNLHLSTLNDCNEKDFEVVQGLQFTRLEQKQTSTSNLKMKNMKELRLLVINNCENANLISTILEQSTRLRWLNIQYANVHNKCHSQCICRTNKVMQVGPNQLQQLRVLEIEGCEFLELFPNESFPILPLKKMRLQNCEALEEFPSGLNNLVALEELDFSGCKKLRVAREGFGGLRSLKRLIMLGCESLEEFPSGLNNLVALEELDFSGCKKLRVPSEGFGGLRSLKRLIMLGCESLEEFPSGLNNLVAVEDLDFSGCKKLRVPSQGFEGLRSLKRLILLGCESLEEFPSGLNNLVALEELDFSGCKKLRVPSHRFEGLRSLKRLILLGCESLEEFPSGLNNLVAVEELDFSGCKKLRVPLEGFGGLRSLKRLILLGCESLEEFPLGLNNLVALEELDFSGCEKLRVAREGFGGLRSLKRLIMLGCESLEEFPLGLNNLVALEELDFSGCKKLRVPSEGFGGLRSLKRLIMLGCESLEEFPSGLNNLVAVEDLDFSGCKKLRVAREGFGGLRSLKRLIMLGCESLEEIPLGLNNLVALEELNFLKCTVLRRALEGFEGLKSLKRLIMSECEALEEFPSGLNNLVALEELEFLECKVLRRAPEGLGDLRSLKRLIMWECESLEEFPSGLNNLVALEELDFSECTMLRMAPEGFGGLKSLRRLIMWKCEALEEFPSGLNNLVQLEEFDFSWCKALRMTLEGFGGLTSLKTLRMRNCEALEELPSGLNNLVALEELNFSQCKAVRTVPEGFGGLTSLKKLIMWGCEALEEFPSGLNNLVALEQLDFAWCNTLEAIPEGFGGLTSLKKLRMSNCKALEEFPLGLNHLVGLEELNFSRCKTSKATLDGFGGLTSLKRLIMWYCEGLEDCLSGLNNLVALEELCFSQCKLLKVLPEGFGGLTSLKRLIILNCELFKEFPSGLNNLVALEELNFSGCKVLRVALEGFWGLASLQRLIMQDCDTLEKFPSGLNNLVALEELDVSRCKALRGASEGFGGLRSLKRLIMRDCEALEEFPLGLNNLEALEELDVSRCKALRGRHEGFGGLTSLKRLIMWDCESLEEFPLGLNNLVALEELDFSGCKLLRVAPEGLGSLTNLKILRMGNCESLEELPSGLNNLVVLEELNFSRCKVLRGAPEGFDDVRL